MTERDALLAAILSSPKDDTPRMIYADWLDERGEVERSEFIRVQCELANRRNLMCNRCEKFQNRLRHFTSHCRGDVCNLRRREYLTSRSNILWEWPKNGVSDYLFPAHIATPDDWHRGFLRSVALSWSDFLRHHAALIWSPRQATECPDCGGDGFYESSSRSTFAGTTIVCKQCKTPTSGVYGTGRIPRPFVPTAQPIETVRISAWPEGCLAFLANMRFDLSSYRFDRVKCGTCGGQRLIRSDGYGNPSEIQGYVTTCPECHGQPLNLWRCESWPDQVFVVPITS